MMMSRRSSSSTAPTLHIKVKRAMNEINKARRLRMAAVDEGESVKIRAIKEAEAEVGAKTSLENLLP